jgi:hypothetical protein
MIKAQKQLLFFFCLLLTGTGHARDAVKLYFQVYNQGVIIPLYPSNSYGLYPNQKQQIFACGTYYHTLNISVKTKDSTHLNPTSNHKIQAAFIEIQKDEVYELEISRKKGFDNTGGLEYMKIEISKLNTDGQLIIPFKAGTYKLKEMKFFDPLDIGESPDFFSSRAAFKNEMKVDSTSRYSNGSLKAKYYEQYPNYPLYYVEEYDSITKELIASGFRLMIAQVDYWATTKKAVWSNSDLNKHGYWEYFKDGVRTKHKLWAGGLMEEFHWYSAGKLKYEFHQSTPYPIKNDSEVLKFAYYYPNGNIYRRCFSEKSSRTSFLEFYTYDKKGRILLLERYTCIDGVSPEKLIHRNLYHSNGRLKMSEEFSPSYQIKYFNPDGTEKKNY